MWLKAQAIQLAQGPIKPTGSIYRAQLGVKRCSGICLLVGTSGKGLGCSLTLEPVIIIIGFPAFRNWSFFIGRLNGMEIH